MKVTFVVSWSQTLTTRGLKNQTVQLLMIGHLEEAFDWPHYLPYIHSNFSRYPKTQSVLVFGGNNCILIVHGRLLNEHSFVPFLTSTSCQRQSYTPNFHFSLNQKFWCLHIAHSFTQSNIKSFMKCLYSLIFHI